MQPPAYLIVLMLILSGPTLQRTSAQRADPPILITEVMPNTGHGARDADFEWVELHNQSNTSISLLDWTISDNPASETLPDMSIPPGGYALVVSTTAALAEPPLCDDLPAGVVVVVIDGRIGNGLANTGDRILLRDPEGNAVHGVSWGVDRSLASLPAPDATQTLTYTVGGSYRLAAPSPGRDAPTTVPTALIPLRITEIFANAGAGTNDARFEWVELHNPTDRAVDLNGWQLTDNAASDVLSAGVIPAGGYAVIAASQAAAPDIASVFLVSDGRLGNGLANTGDTVTLIDPAGRIVDSVDYRGAPLRLPEPQRSIAPTVDGWVLNLEPSPGTASVAPLLATSAIAAPSPATTPPLRQSDPDRGIPAWAGIAVAFGLPALVLEIRYGMRRRRTAL